MRNSLARAQAVDAALSAELEELQSASRSQDETIACLKRLISSAHTAIEEFDGGEVASTAPYITPPQLPPLPQDITSDSVTDSVLYACELLRAGAMFRKHNRHIRGAGAKRRWVWLSDDFERLSWAQERGARPLGSLSIAAIHNVVRGLLSKPRGKSKSKAVCQPRTFTIIVEHQEITGAATPPSSPSRGGLERSASGASVLTAHQYATGSSATEIERTLELEALNEATLSSWLTAFAVIRDGSWLLPLAAKVAHHRRMLERRASTPGARANGRPRPRAHARGASAAPVGTRRTSFEWGSSSRAANAKLCSGVPVRLHKRGRKQHCFVWCAPAERLERIYWGAARKCAGISESRESTAKGSFSVDALRSVVVGIDAGDDAESFARDAQEGSCLTLSAVVCAGAASTAGSAAVAAGSRHSSLSASTVARSVDGRGAVGAGSSVRRLYLEFKDDAERDEWAEVLRYLIHDPTTREPALEARRNSLCLRECTQPVGTG